jgi:hypothetical protein
MYGIPANSTAGLRSNYAGSDLIVDTNDPRTKLLVQVKTGYSPAKDQIYLTQCAGDDDLTKDKFVADFVVFVNLDQKAGKAHEHDGKLDFEHLTFYVVPRDIPNKTYKDAVKRDYDKPLKTGGRRKLGNMAVNVQSEQLARYKDAWPLMREAGSKNVA